MSNKSDSFKWVCLTYLKLNSLEGEEEKREFTRNYPNEQSSPKLHFNYISSSSKKGQINPSSMFNDLDDQAP